MPRLLRHKVLAFPLPNLLPVLPPSFTETAKLKHKETLLAEPTSKKVNGRSGRPSVLPTEVEDVSARAETTGSGMDVDEIGSTVASTEVNGTELHAASARSEGILTHEQELQQGLEAALAEMPLTDLPTPNERDLLDFFQSRTLDKQDDVVHTNGKTSGNNHTRNHTQDVNGSSSRSVSQSAPTLGQFSQKDKEWKEPEVFYIKETGEIFLDYEKYVERILFYKRKIFNSENNVHNSSETVTSFFGALEGEKTNSMAAQGGLPPVLKKACLRVSQFSLDGRLEGLMDKTFARLQNRFFPQEKVFVEIGKDSYLANIAEVIAPSSPPTSSRNGKKAVRREPHAGALNSRVTQEEADKADDPNAYRYMLQLISSEDLERNSRRIIAEDKSDMWGNRTIEVGPEAISRDKNEFSKLAIKRLLRDSLGRDSMLCSPWLVHEPLARKYGISTEIPADVQKISDAERKVQIEKRRRTSTKDAPAPEVVEEGPPAKKQKVEGSAATAKKRKSAAQKAEEAARKAEEERIKKEQEEEAARIEAEKKKKKPMKYPAEDYLVEYTPRDKTLGKPLVRPSFSSEIPFPMHFETFVTTWNFLNALSKPLGLSPFTIDEYEHALYHTNPAQPCVLLQEIHQTLLSLIRADALINQDLVLPLKGAVPPAQEGESEGDSSDESEEDDDDDEDKQEKIKLVTTQAGILAAEFGVKETNGKVGRRDWEGMLAGCLWQRGTTHSVPNLIHYLLGLLLEAENVPTGRPTWSAASTRPKVAKNLSARYLALHSVFKLEIVAFLCELTMQTGVIRDYYDQAALALSKCRNDQNANKRELAKIRGEKPEGDPEMNGELNGQGEDTPSIAAKESEDSSLSEAESSSAGISRQEKVKAARQRKEMEAKQAQMEFQAATKKKKADDKARRLEKEEEERLVARSAELAREFRRQYNSMRTYPLGQDRFLHTIWWLDGCGTADLVGADGEAVYGTGRIYIQAPSEPDLKRLMEEEELDEEEVAAKRKAEEPEGDRLEQGEWAAIDTPEQLESYLNWLSEKGKREGKLIKTIGQLRPLIEAGMRKRGELFAPEPEVEEHGLTARRQKRNSGKNPYRSGESYLGYKNTYR